MSGELAPASVYVSLLPVVEACVVVAVPGRVGEVRVAADEPEAVDLDPGVTVLARRLEPRVCKRKKGFPTSYIISEGASGTHRRYRDAVAVSAAVTVPLATSRETQAAPSESRFFTVLDGRDVSVGMKVILKDNANRMSNSK